MTSRRTWILSLAAILLVGLALFTVRYEMFARRYRAHHRGAFWIAPRCPDGLVTMRRTFELESEPGPLVLRATAHPAASFRLNGVELIRTGYEHAWRLLPEVDATPWAREGVNELSVTLLSPDGGGELLVWLGDPDSPIPRLATNDEWTACGQSVTEQRVFGGGPWRWTQATSPTTPTARTTHSEAVWTAPTGGGLLALPRDMAGFPVITGVSSDTRVILGESRAEAQSSQPYRQLSARELDANGRGFLREAFRYVRIDPPQPGAHVGILPTGAAGEPRGWFRCSDPELEHAYDVSAWSVRANLQDLLEDGIKRDRLAWSGDLLVAVPAACYVLGPQVTVERTLRVLVARRTAAGAVPPVAPIPVSWHLVDYVGAWIVAVTSYVQQTGDDTLRAELAPVVREQERWLAERMKDGPLLVPPSDTITDWMSHSARTGPVTYQQGMALLARSAAADLLGDDEIRRAVQADRARISRLVQPTDLGVLPDRLEEPACPPSHDASVLGILGGLASDPDTLLTSIQNVFWTAAGPRAYADACADAPSDGRLISPFMAGLEAWARFQQGDADGACELIRRTWRPMTESGCAYEAMDLTGAPLIPSPEAPYRTSLCHSWSSAPAWLLPAYVLGVRPLAPGYRRYVVAPEASSLTWAEGSVPMGADRLDVSWRTGDQGIVVNITAPPGHVGFFDPAGLMRAVQVKLDGETTEPEGELYPIPVGQSRWELAGDHRGDGG